VFDAEQTARSSQTTLFPSSTPRSRAAAENGRVKRNCTTSLPCTHLKVSKYGVHVTDTAVLSAYRGGGRWTGLTFQGALDEETNKGVLSSGPAVPNSGVLASRQRFIQG
jgi:hypothetical protein